MAGNSAVLQFCRTHYLALFQFAWKTFINQVNDCNNTQHLSSLTKWFSSSSPQTVYIYALKWSSCSEPYILPFPYCARTFFNSCKRNTNTFWQVPAGEALKPRHVCPIWGGIRLEGHLKNGVLIVWKWCQGVSIERFLGNHPSTSLGKYLIFINKSRGTEILFCLWAYHESYLHWSLDMFGHFFIAHFFSRGMLGGS